MTEDSGRSAGGLSRAKKLSPDRRKQIAQDAAAARWGKLPAAAFGSADKPLIIAGTEIQAYVLDDGTRVLARSGFLKAIGRTGKAKGGRQYDEGFQTPVFLTAENLKPYISSEILGNSKPIVFQLPNGTEVIGYKAELLPEVCEVFMDAYDAGKLRANQIHIAEACKALHRAFAKTGIIALVDEATGYQGFRPHDALQKYLEMVVRKELAVWAKRFPDEFYENIYKLKNWPWPGMAKNRYSVVAHYTRDLVYERLAPSLLHELEIKNPKNDNGQRSAKFHQWLSDDVGNPLLQQHLHSLIMFQRLAIASGYGWNRFVKMVDAAMPRKGATLELPLGDA